MSRQAHHEMGGVKRSGAVSILLVAAVSGFGCFPSIPKSCINQRYGVADSTCLGLLNGGDCNLFSPVELNAKHLGAGGGGGWGRWGGSGGDGGGGDDNSPMGEDGGDGFRYLCCYHCCFISVFGVACGMLLPNLNAVASSSFLSFHPPSPISSDGISAMALSGIFGSFWDKYVDILNKNPVLTKASTSLAGFSIADVLAQKFVSQGNDTSFSYARMVRMASFGFLIHGTLSHFFYAKLDDLIPGTCIDKDEYTTLCCSYTMRERDIFDHLAFCLPPTVRSSRICLSSGTSAQNVVIKMLTDQVLWAPIFTAIFLTYISTLEGKTPWQVHTYDEVYKAGHSVNLIECLPFVL